MSMLIRLLVCVLGLSPAVAMATTAAELIENMATAMRSTTYSGVFIYHHNNSVEARLKIFHRNTAQGVEERLLSISGEQREIIRTDSVVTCIWPDRKLVIIDKSQSRQHFPGIVPDDISRLPTNYKPTNYKLLMHEQPQRVAERDAWVVDVSPHDQHRYGYRLWIDKDTGLLVGSEVLDEQQQSIEKLLFTELNVHDTLPDGLFKAKLLQADYRWRELSAPTAKHSVTEQKWQAANLPPGFFMQTHKQWTQSANQALVEQIVFSDGMASISVFIESKFGDHLPLGSQRRGGLNVYGKTSNNHHITVMGEVPNQTVRLVADSIDAEVKSSQE